jgi:hypothetical protein
MTEIRLLALQNLIRKEFDNRRNMMPYVIALLMVLLLAVPAYAVDGNQLLEQVDRNLAP